MKKTILLVLLIAAVAILTVLFALRRSESDSPLPEPRSELGDTSETVDARECSVADSLSALRDKYPDQPLLARPFVLDVHGRYRPWYLKHNFGLPMDSPDTGRVDEDTSESYLLAQYYVDDSDHVVYLAQKLCLYEGDLPQTPDPGVVRETEVETEKWGKMHVIVREWPADAEKTYTAFGRCKVNDSLNQERILLIHACSHPSEEKAFEALQIVVGKIRRLD